MMHLDFAPRRQLVEWLSSGWSPVPGYEYQPGEYAFLLAQDGAKRALRNARLVAATLLKGSASEPLRMSNNERGCMSARVTKMRRYSTLNPLIIRKMIARNEARA